MNDRDRFAGVQRRGGPRSAEGVGGRRLAEAQEGEVGQLGIGRADQIIGSTAGARHILRVGRRPVAIRCIVKPVKFQRVRLTRSGDAMVGSEKIIVFKRHRGAIGDQRAGAKNKSFIVD